MEQHHHAQRHALAAHVVIWRLHAGMRGMLTHGNGVDLPPGSHRELRQARNAACSQNRLRVPVDDPHPLQVDFALQRQALLLDPRPPGPDHGYDALLATPTAFGDAAQVGQGGGRGSGGNGMP